MISTTESKNLMIKTTLLTKTSIVALASLFALTSASFAEPENFSVELSPILVTQITKKKSAYGTFDIFEEQNGLNYVAIDIKEDNVTGEALLFENQMESIKAYSKLDTAVKTGIVVAGVGAGAALAWFYGPVIAYEIAYQGSMALAYLANPNPSWVTYYGFMKPAAIRTGLLVADSTLVKLATGAVSTTLGGGLGKLGCAGYEATKSVVSTCFSATTSSLGWMGSKIWG